MYYLYCMNGKTNGWNIGKILHSAATVVGVQKVNFPLGLHPSDEDWYPVYKCYLLYSKFWHGLDVLVLFPVYLLSALLLESGPIVVHNWCDGCRTQWLSVDCWRDGIMTFLAMVNVWMESIYSTIWRGTDIWHQWLEAVTAGRGRKKIKNLKLMLNTWDQDRKDMKYRSEMSWRKVPFPLHGSPLLILLFSPLFFVSMDFSPIKSDRVMPSAIFSVHIWGLRFFPLSASFRSLCEFCISSSSSSVKNRRHSMD